MIDHMERLILKSEPLAPVLATPAKASQLQPMPVPAPGDTSFFVRKSNIRRYATT